MDEVKKSRVHRLREGGGENVLVTGAAKRLGRAIALTWRPRAGTSAVHYQQLHRRCRRRAAEARARASKPQRCRPTCPARPKRKRLVERAAAAIGPLTALINSASLFENDDWHSATRTSWDAHIEVNLRAPLVLSQAFAAGAAARRTGQHHQHHRPARAEADAAIFVLQPSKAGLHWLTTTLAQGMAPCIRVNAVGPGPTLRNERQSEADFARQRDTTVLKRGADPADICAAMRYLLSAGPSPAR